MTTAMRLVIESLDSIVLAVLVAVAVVEGRSRLLRRRRPPVHSGPDRTAVPVVPPDVVPSPRRETATTPSCRRGDG